MYPICVTCGVQFAETSEAPGACPICTDERQFVGWDGQRWTTLRDLQQSHGVVVRQEDAGLVGIGIEPHFAIGQRGLLVRSIGGNVLWDCMSLIDEASLRAVKAQGGIDAIAISHPHFYGAMVEWSRAFGGAPIYLHGNDRAWVMRPDPCIHFWKGRTLDLRGGLRLVSTGGHFEGYQVLHWPSGAEGRGALMAGDQPQIGMDPEQVSFMYSYPNYIPLNATAIRRIVECLDPLEYDRIYGAFFIRGKGVVPAGGKTVVRRSADRYLRAIGG